MDDHDYQPPAIEARERIDQPLIGVITSGVGGGSTSAGASPIWKDTPSAEDG